MLQHSTSSVTQPEPLAVTSVRKTIQIGPREVEGFMLPNGEFRQGMRSTGRVIDVTHGRVRRILSSMLPTGADPLSWNESHSLKGSKPTSSYDPVIRVVGRPESMLSLPLSQKVWSHVARHGVGKSQEMAWEMLDVLAGVSLERSYQEAFGVSDSRSQEERLLDFFIDWNIGKYRVLFDNQFQHQFKEVTGHDINSKSKHVKFIISNFLYNRLPSQVYEAMMDLNPIGEKGNRKYKHHQLLTDEARREAVVPIITALKAVMMQAPRGSVKYVNEQMDKMYPAQRGTRHRTSNARYNQTSFNI